MTQRKRRARYHYPSAESSRRRRTRPPRLHSQVRHPGERTTIAAVVEPSAVSCPLAEISSAYQPPCRLASSALSRPPPAGSRAIVVIDSPAPHPVSIGLLPQEPMPPGSPENLHLESRLRNRHRDRRGVILRGDSTGRKRNSSGRGRDCPTGLLE